MPRFKVLKGVAHDIGHSFTSLMNHSIDDYSTGHNMGFAREPRESTVTIDFLTGEDRSDPLLRDPISELPCRYTKMFWDLVTRSGSDRALVQSATLTLKYDLQRTQPVRGTERPQSPYTCDVSILDIRGKSYTAHFEGWWYVERQLPSEPPRRWWNPVSWFLY